MGNALLISPLQGRDQLTSDARQRSRVRLRRSCRPDLMAGALGADQRAFQQHEELIGQKFGLRRLRRGGRERQDFRAKSCLHCSITQRAGCPFSGNSTAALASAQPRDFGSLTLRAASTSQASSSARAVAGMGCLAALTRRRASPRPVRADIPPPARPSIRSAGTASSCWCRRPPRSRRRPPHGCRADRTGRAPPQ